jgi:hypothetical protein
MVLKDHNTRGIRQGNISYAPKTRDIAPIKVLNPPRVDNHLQTGHWDPSLQGLSRDMGKLFHLVSNLFNYLSSSSICKQPLLRWNFPHPPPSEASK